MKYVTIAIEDRSAMILECSKRFEETKKEYRSTMKQVNNLQTEALMKMLAYIKCAFDDYAAISGNAGLEVSICFGTIVITRDYIRIRMFQNEIYAKVKDNRTIEVRDAFPRSISNLMQKWETVREAIRETINEKIARRQSEMDKLLEESKTMLRIAQNFEV